MMITAAYVLVSFISIINVVSNIVFIIIITIIFTIVVFSAAYFDYYQF